MTGGSAVELAAGPLRALLIHGELREICYCGVEILQRIYVAVRDPNWDTVPAQLSSVEIEKGRERFEVSFRASHSQGPMQFAWRGCLRGSPEGALHLSAEGRAWTEFDYNKIGFNLHHSLGSARGRPFRAFTETGLIEGTLPDLVAPQEYVDGLPTPLFEPFSKLELDLRHSIRLSIGCTGDLFEMQDHRNWTDANFKTYGTPLAVGFPRRLTKGEEISQSLVIEVDQPAGERFSIDASDRAMVEIGRASKPPPELGTALTPGAPEIGEREVELLSLIGFGHLRCDLKLDASDWNRVLDRAARQANAVGARLLVAAHVHRIERQTLKSLAEAIVGAEAEIVRVQVIQPGEPVSTEVALMAVREAFSLVGCAAEVVGGTDAYFAELNREIRDAAAMDAVAYTINPQVHIFDDRALFENLGAQLDTVETARHLYPGLPLGIGAVSLRPRFNPNATTGGLDERGIPYDVDTRQPSLLAASWALGMLANLLSAPLEWLTAFEAVGEKGLLQGPRAAIPGFGASAGDVFPVFHVLADANPSSTSRLRACRVEGPVSALAIEGDRNLVVLISNQLPDSQTVCLRGTQGRGLHCRTLDASTVEQARREPEIFRSSGAYLPVDDEIEFELAPYACLRIDARRS